MGMKAVDNFLAVRAVKKILRAQRPFGREEYIKAYYQRLKGVRSPFELLTFQDAHVSEKPNEGNSASEPVYVTSIRRGFPLPVNMELES